MTKKLAVILALAFLVFLAGCQPKASPEERLKEYIGHWNKEEFSEMYSTYLNQGTKEAYASEDFVERQQKLYTDLAIENIEVTYTKPSKDENWDTEKPADFPVQVKMDTMAGPIEFEKNMTLLYETAEDKEDWFIEWDPSFIFEQLATGDEVRVSATRAKRGEILDRNEQPIAINGTGYNVGVVPENFKDASAKKELATVLGVSVASIDEKLNQSWVQENQFVPISKVAKDNTQLLEKVKAVPGATYQETTMREYPYGEALGHLSGYIGPMTAEKLEELKDQGYTSTDLIGRRGLEQTLEERLRGENGLKILIKKQGDTGEELTIAETPAKDGETVVLTIDAELQKSTYEAMEGEAGTSAAVNPKTGETLVLVSSPAYNPNEYMLGISEDRFKELSEDPLNPLFNRFGAAYAPGSTIKPITAAIGMEAGTLEPSVGLQIDGATWQKDGSWGDYRVTRLHPEAPNPVDLNTALVYSDNIYFARQALEMGNQAFVSGLQRFGFGEEIPFALELQSSQISNEGTLGSQGQLADTSFGQGQMLTNILHLASMYEPFLTDGTMYKPLLFMDEEKSQVWKEGLLSAENAKVLRTGMRNVVVDGYAQSANSKTVKIAGKTGTAELKGAIGEEGQENGFFVAYDSESPDFILAMMIESIEENGGSDYVAGFATKVFENYKAE
ncbi:MULTISPECIES: penicillin-binding transpeptidase domain-containing protein [Planococcus]|uniref:Peptidoglycan glycosyltransferase n=1 Tax=Planococcus faecalis TaxID=1598147 RepID=A0ABM6IQK7_9BACL|nr:MULTISPECIES: penicillin-binding transpeptidase domain-containing protein [Planococcus]AQU78597.1 peptidoglycan glycosyltransferase [Planococcus faecalis]MDJ0331430.1 penicillin-binding transpeptidase domain-containing protein [Planococcus sp. S3-L1]